MDQLTESFKVPPHSIDAEQSILGGLLINNESWDNIASIINEEDFYRRDHRLIFTEIRTQIEKGKPCDVVTLSERLESLNLLDEVGGLAYLGSLVNNTPSASNIRAYADIVRERSVLRQLIQIGNDIADSAFNTEGRKSDDILEAAEKTVFEISDKGANAGNDFKGMTDLLKKTVDRIDELYQNGGSFTGIPSGFTDFDGLTSGLQPADLVIVAGRPSMGKTSFAMNLAENAAIGAGVGVAVFSMEMPAESLTLRMLSSLGRINQTRVRSGQLDEDDWPRLTSAVSILNEANIFIDDTPALSPTEMRARVRRLKRKHNIGLIVVDYLQLMQIKGQSENRVNEISEISRGLKALAKEMNVPVVALSQLNRGLEQRPNKRPVMSDLRECVTGETRVVLSNGQRIAIKDLAGKQAELYALNETGKIISAKSDKIWKVGEKQVYKIHLASGRTIRASSEHRFMTDLSWKKVIDIQTGNRIALAHKIPEPKISSDMSDHKIILLAHLIGDGSYLKGQPLRYTTNSEENSRIVTTAAIEEFSVKVNRHQYKNETWHQLVFSGNGNRWHPQGINKWLRDLQIFDQRSHEKQIPDSVFSFSDKKLSLLLKHLWATDGTIFTRPLTQKGSHVIHYSTNSKRLADDVSFLLQRLGIISRTKRTQKKDYKPGYLVCITGVSMQQLFLSQIGGFGPRCDQAEVLSKRISNVQENSNVDTLPVEIFSYIKTIMRDTGISQRKMASMRGTSYGGTSHFKFSPSRKTVQSYANSLKDEYLHQQASNDLFWDKVVLIEEDGIEDVYDLTVPGYENWLADGIISHNSGAIEQDADLIVFIYRDEVYDEDSPDKGTAEIIISKHRNGPLGVSRLTFLGQYTKFENHASIDYAD